MKLALIFGFSNFNVSFRVEGQFFAQVTMAMITILAMYLIWKRNRRH